MSNDNQNEFEIIYKELERLKRLIANGGAIVKQFYNIQELSVITGITVLGLKGRRKRGKVKMFNDGNEILITVTEVNRYLKKLGQN